MLDYAANAAAYWPGGGVVASFARTCEANGEDADAQLTAFLGQDEPTFWDRVDANFRSGVLKLVFVADHLPSELTRIVQFLDDQMRADVRGVELGWYTDGEGGRTLVPRFVRGERKSADRTAKGKADSEPSSVESWIEANVAPLGVEYVSAARHWIALCEEASAKVAVSKSKATVYAAWQTPEGRTRYPLSLSKNDCAVTLNTRFLAPHRPFSEERVRQALYDALDRAYGPLSTRSLNGYPSFPLLRFVERPDALAAFLRSLTRLIGKSSHDFVDGVTTATG